MMGKYNLESLEHDTDNLDFEKDIDKEEVDEEAVLEDLAALEDLTVLEDLAVLDINDDSDDGDISFSGLMNRDLDNTVVKEGYTPAQCARISTGTQNYCPFAGSGR